MLRQPSNRITKSITLRLILGMVMLIAVLALVNGCTEESIQEPMLAQDEPVVQPKAGLNPIDPVPVPPTSEQQVDLLERIIVGESLDQADVSIVRYFNDTYIEPLSPASRVAMTAFLDEVALTGMFAYEFESQWRQLQTPHTLEYQAFAAELESLLEFTLAGKDGGATIIAGAALIGGLIGCVGKAEACMDDSLDNQKLCMRQQCGPGEKADVNCCYDEAIEDIDNCAWSCGLNTADPEYNSNCCERVTGCAVCHISPVPHYGIDQQYKAGFSKPLSGDCTR